MASRPQPVRRHVHAPTGRPETWGGRILKYVRRLLFLALYGAAGYLLYAFILQPLVLDTGDEAAAPAAQAPAAPVTQAPPPRPEGIPARIPAWAWEMHAWHGTPAIERGLRPAEAPQRLPQWYWEWRQWRVAVER